MMDEKWLAENIQKNARDCYGIVVHFVNQMRAAGLTPETLLPLHGTLQRIDDDARQILQIIERRESGLDDG